MAKRRESVPEGAELLVCRNPQATHSYEILERIEAGLVLQGSEVKSLRQRRASLEGAYASIVGNEAFLHKMHIAPYEQATVFGHEPKRSRKLLLHRGQIERLRGKLAQRGLTLVPLRVYFKDGYAKVELGLGRGRTKGDQRQEMRRKVDTAEAREAMKRRR